MQENYIKTVTVLLFKVNVLLVLGAPDGLRRAPLRCGFLFAERAYKRTQPFCIPGACTLRDFVRLHLLKAGLIKKL